MRLIPDRVHIISLPKDMDALAVEAFRRALHEATWGEGATMELPPLVFVPDGFSVVPADPEGTALLARAVLLWSQWVDEQSSAQTDASSVS